MSKRIFGEQEMRQLLDNKNVAKCSDRSISFTAEFKINAVKLYEQGVTSTEIFKQAGFDLNVIGKDIPKDRLGDWNKIFKTKGINGLQAESRGKGGGRPKNKGLTERERIKYLEAEVAYLKAENDFLAKLRAKRRAE